MTTPTPNVMPGAAPAATGALPVTPSQPPAAAPAVIPAAVAPPAATAAAPANADAPKPPWEAAGEDFNPERAWNLITNLRRENAEHKAQTDPIVAEHEASRRAALQEQDRLREDLDKTTARENTWRDQAIRAQAEAMATGKFISTKAAVALIGDLSMFGTDEGIDVAKLQARLDQLAAEEPNLVVPQGRPGLTPNRGQGQSGNGQIPLDAQIKAAQASGNIAQSIALKQQQRYQK